MGRQNKVIGIFGGEPLMTKEFPEYVNIMCALIPESCHRGLWTSLDWTVHAYADDVRRLLGFAPGQVKPKPNRVRSREGFLNWNMHEETNHCEHHPTLVAVKDVHKDNTVKQA